MSLSKVVGKLTATHQPSPPGLIDHINIISGKIQNDLLWKSNQSSNQQVLTTGSDSKNDSNKSPLKKQKRYVTVCLNVLDIALPGVICYLSPFTTRESTVFFSKCTVEAITYTAALGACESSDEWNITLRLLQEVIAGGYDEWTTNDIDYIHYYQAGSPHDCLKHCVLVDVLSSFVEDASPFVYIDTHAGAGIYDLKSPEAQKFQNHQGGIVTLMSKDVKRKTSRTIQDYLGLQKISDTNAGDIYLGSPAIAQSYLRPQDECFLFEASSEVSKSLDLNLCSLSNQGADLSQTTRIYCTNSYTWFSNPKNLQEITRQRRICALIDPPYDTASSSDKWNLFLIKQLRQCFPQSCVLLWYPFASEEHTLLGVLELVLSFTEIWVSDIVMICRWS